MHEPPELVLRASSLSAYLDCQLRTAAHGHAALFRAHGHELAPFRGSVAALIGTGVHAGAEAGLKDRMFGHSPALSTMQDSGVEGFRERLAGEEGQSLVFDDEALSLPQAEMQVARMVARYRRDVVLESHPVAVESRVEALLRPGVVISGQTDLLCLDAVERRQTLRDLKTARRRQPAVKHMPQIGAYGLLLRSCGHQPEAAQIDELPRVKLNKEQPPVEQRPLDIGACEQVAHVVASEFASKLEAFREDGDPGRFLPNPASYLCGPKFCRLHGQPTCPATRSLVA